MEEEEAPGPGAGFLVVVPAAGFLVVVTAAWFLVVPAAWFLVVVRFLVVVVPAALHLPLPLPRLPLPLPHLPPPPFPPPVSSGKLVTQKYITHMKCTMKDKGQTTLSACQCIIIMKGTKVLTLGAGRD